MRFLLLLCLAATAEAQEATLVWRTGPRTHYASRELVLDAAPPPGVRPIQREDVRYARVPFLLAVRPGTVWIDRDFDGDLNDEPPFVLPATVEMRREGLRVHVFEEKGSVRIAPLAHREGTVVLEGRVRKVALYDSDGDLRFEDPAKDRLLLDVDGDGEPEEIVAGAPFGVRGAAYVAGVPPADGRKVAFRKVEGSPVPVARRWTPLAIPPAGREAPGGDETLRTLRTRYEHASKLAKKNDASFATIRGFLLNSIGELGTNAAYRFLLRVQQSEKEPEVRAAAVAAMGYGNYRRNAAQVRKIAAKDDAPEVRAAALLALHDMGAPDRAPVLEAALLAAKDERVSEAAALGLAWSGAPRTALEAARTLPSPALRYHAYLAGTRYSPTPPPAAAVLAAAAEDEPRLRALALRDAAQLGLPEARALAFESLLLARLNEDLQLAVVDILAGWGDAEAVEAVLPLLKLGSEAVRDRVVDLLRPVREAGAVAAVVGALDDEAAAIRCTAARVLAAVPAETVPAALATRLAKEEERTVLRALVHAAGEQRVAAAAPRIADVARKEPALRRDALRALARIGTEHEVVRGFFRATLGQGSWEERILAIDAAAAAGDTAFAPGVVANLGHEVWQVRLAAAQGLTRLRVKEAVEPLIGRLAAEETKRVRRAVAEALFRITGRQLLDMEELWRKWWEGNAGTFEVPARVTGEAGERKTVATFYGVPVDSDRIIFVIDRSGSMARRGDDGRTELQEAVEATLETVKRLDPESRVGVVLFASDVKAWRKDLVPLGPGARQALARFLHAQNARGGTNLFDALETALLIEGCDTVYLLSDGAPTAGKLRRTEDILLAVGELNELRRIVIHCVSLGGESDLLKELAARSGGRYVVR